MYISKQVQQELKKSYDFLKIAVNRAPMISIQTTWALDEEDEYGVVDNDDKNNNSNTTSSTTTIPIGNYFYFILFQYILYIYIFFYF